MVWRYRSICTTLVEGIIGNNSVKNFEFGAVVKKEMSFKDISFVRYGGHFISQSRTISAMYDGRSESSRKKFIKSHCFYLLQ